MSLTPERQSQQPQQPKAQDNITYGGVDVLIDYAKLITFAKENYGTYFDRIFQMLIGDTDTTISGQFSELEGDALTWFVYALHLISMLEQPFRKGHDSLDDVSLFLLRELDERLNRKSSPRSAAGT